MKREIKMTEFVDAYCSELRDALNIETKQDSIEVNFTATEFNALMEVVKTSYSAVYMQVVLAACRCWE